MCVACRSYGADETAGLGNGANCISATAEPAYALAIRIMTRMATNMVPPQCFSWSLNARDFFRPGEESWLLQP
jgi:hypothetical protein